MIDQETYWFEPFLYPMLQTRPRPELSVFWSLKVLRKILGCKRGVWFLCSTWNEMLYYKNKVLYKTEQTEYSVRVTNAKIWKLSIRKLLLPKSSSIPYENSAILRSCNYDAKLRMKANCSNIVRVAFWDLYTSFGFIIPHLLTHKQNSLFDELERVIKLIYNKSFISFKPWQWNHQIQ